MKKEIKPIHRKPTPKPATNMHTKRFWKTVELMCPNFEKSHKNFSQNLEVFYLLHQLMVKRKGLNE